VDLRSCHVWVTGTVNVIVAVDYLLSGFKLFLLSLLEIKVNSCAYKFVCLFVQVHICFITALALEFSFRAFIGDSIVRKCSCSCRLFDFEQVISCSLPL
jgi:hypothetical protein